MAWYDYSNDSSEPVLTLVFKNTNGDIVKTRKLNENCEDNSYRYALEGTKECGYIVFRDEFYNNILMKIKVPSKEWVLAEVEEFYY